MPLLPPGDLFSPESILSQIPTSTSPESPHFLIFFAEWCPDCTEVQSSLDQHVPDKNSTLVLVGDRTQCVLPLSLHSTRAPPRAAPRACQTPTLLRTPENRWKESKFREPPFNVTRIPTLIRVEQGGDALASSVRSLRAVVMSALKLANTQLCQLVPSSTRRPGSSSRSCAARSSSRSSSRSALLSPSNSLLHVNNERVKQYIRVPSSRRCRERLTRFPSSACGSCQRLRLWLLAACRGSLPLSSPAKIQVFCMCRR